ncbi:ABC transporter ATP-binding protein [Alteromonas sp. 5E99-2]|uniref:ATP-binding cassette domain-containing protein n=1 Tax=Alteromonas sp. 5E99-2 TaxID=2817683 RepID=UPI001A9A18F0|nr:ABC transporter ATP-binding protein [Alteromonas sp. 5E99-2]
MIKLEKITKYYRSSKGKQYVFKDLSFDIPSGFNIALLGSNGAGKSTLFRLLAGSEYPNRGKIRTDLSLSWPVALSTGIHAQMTGLENSRFIGRINGVHNLDEYVDKVAEFSDLGVKFDLPVRTYSSGMRSRLAFACSLGIDFDTYLIDEVTAVGDKAFKEKAKQQLLAKSKTANVIMVSHQLNELRAFCDSAIVLHRGKLQFFRSIEDGISYYENL